MIDRPLKILMTDPHLKGGGQVRYLANLSRELTRLGHSVTIGCKRDSVLVERAREAGCAAHNRFVFRGGLRPRAWHSDLKTARAFVRTQQPDLIHVSGSQDHWVCATANRFMGHPVALVRTRHNTYPVSDNPANRVLNRGWTDYQIVVCDTVRKTLACQKAFDPSRMCSIHNGVDADQFKPDLDARTWARREFGYAEEHVVCGIAARLSLAKGHRFLFRAAGPLQKDFPYLRILVLGQGDQEASLRQLAQDCGITPLVTFTGFRDDMAYCVQAFDIGVQPSIGCDTSSFSLKEQMAAEKPVVASDYGGLTEIVSDGVEGLVIPSGNVESLGKALKRLLADPVLRCRYGKAGRARVLKDFTVQVFASRTLDAYRSALEIHRERTAH